MAIKNKRDASIEKFIDKGAGVKAIKEKSFKNILVRIPTTILIKIDEHLEQRPWTNRTQWIVEAMSEKLKQNID